MMIFFRATATALGLMMMLMVCGPVEAQDKPDQQPGSVAPNLKRQPEPLPPGRIRPSETPPPETESQELPEAQGCPDRGRKLQLIV